MYLVYIHGVTCDNQRYPWYIYISLVYAKTPKLINGVKIQDVPPPPFAAPAERTRNSVPVALPAAAQARRRGHRDGKRAGPGCAASSHRLEAGSDS